MNCSESGERITHIHYLCVVVRVGSDVCFPVIATELQQRIPAVLRGKCSESLSGRTIGVYEARLSTDGERAIFSRSSPHFFITEAALAEYLPKTATAMGERSAVPA